MVDFPGSNPSYVDPVDVGALLGNQYDTEAPPTVVIGNADFMLGPGGAVLASDKAQFPVNPSREFGAGVTTASMGDTWYEIVHVFPFRFDFGNILTTIVDTIEVYNAYRDEARSLDTFTNNAGAGISITDLPGLPETILAQEGFTLTLQVTTDGPPQINGTIDFGFDVYTISIPITGSRIIMFPFRPEAPVAERLEFLTDIMEKGLGGEQRMALRTYPRQKFDLEFRRSEGTELSRLDFLLFDWQARVFGLPIWHEATVTTAALTSGSTVIPVRSTANADYRAGGLAIIYQDEVVFDALEIASFDGTLITFASPIANDYPSGVEVMPIRTAYANENIRGRRFPKGIGDRSITFDVIDNDVGSSFADATPFIAAGTGIAAIDGRVLLDDPNALDGRTLSEGMTRRILEIDGGTGSRVRVSPWDRSKRSHSKGFVSTTRARIWEIRRLLHFLKGRQKSFWIPTFYEDLIPAQTLVQGSTAFVIENVGYSRFVLQCQSRNFIRVQRAVDGEFRYHEITGSAGLDAQTEQLTISPGWDEDYEPEEIARVDMFTLVRTDTDTIEVLHADPNGSSLVSFPVIEVFE